jgi:hypothetical protein
MNWLCRFGIHRWAKWEFCKLQTVFISENRNIASEGQKRHCEKCNKKQLRSL